MIKKILILLSLLFFTYSSVYADEYYLAQWIWQDNGSSDDSYWEAPYQDKLVGFVDLRTSVQSASMGGVAQGYMFASFTELIIDPSMIYVGKSDATVSASVLASLKATLGLKGSLNSGVPKDVLWQLLTTHSGNEIAPTIMPGTDLRMRMFLGNKQIKVKKLTPNVSPEWGPVLSRLQETYLKIRDYDPDTKKHRKTLSVWREKYRVQNTDVFIPDGEPKVSPLPHNTTITESFNTADSDTLGPDLSWTELIGDIDIVSNEADSVGDGVSSHARADSDLSSDDHYSKVTLTDVIYGGASDSFCGTAVRKDSTTTRTHYHCRLDQPSTLQLYEVTSGSFSSLGTASVTGGDGKVIQSKANGSTISCDWDGVEEISVTDSSITGNLRTSLRLRSLCKVDNYEAADLAAAARRIMVVT